MIQRIQSLYLLMAALTAAATLLPLPLAYFDKGDGFYTMQTLGFSAQGVAPYTGLPQLPWGMLCIGAVVATLCAVTIFRYASRKRQLRLCNWAIVLVVAYYVTYVAYSVAFSQQAETSFQPALGATLPAVALLFVLLAKRGIRHDEELVRAADRIR